MLKKKNNYKLIIGFLIGIILSIPIAFSMPYFTTAGSVDYTPNDMSGVMGRIQDFTVQEAIDVVYSECCPSGYGCRITPNVKVGDYIDYTPSGTSFIASDELTSNTTDYGTNRSIIPQYLDVWRVLRVNTNGTVDIISEYTSENDIIFAGDTGYYNYVMYLNSLASNYENPTYSIGSRIPGYNGTQTGLIADKSKFTNTAPWTCSTGGSCSPVESQGGGDRGYLTDYDLINSVFGTRIAYEVTSAYNENPVATAYCMVSRYYYYGSASNFSWRMRKVSTSGSITSDILIKGNGTSKSFSSGSCALRPIITLKPNISYTGIGSKEHPKGMVVIG